jgi:hypothetical protein
MQPPSAPNPKPRPDDPVVSFDDDVVEEPRHRPVVRWWTRWENTLGLGATLIGVALLGLLVRDIVRDTMPGLQPGAAMEAGSFLALTPTTLEVAPGSNTGIAVRAKGPGGAPLADAVVGFRVESGGGELATDLVRTSAMGIAQTTIRVPPRPGSVSVSAVLTGSDLPPVTFSLVAPALVTPPLGATSLVTPAGPAARVALHGGNRQQASVAGLLPTPIAIQVTDAQGNPVPDVEVRFESLTGGAVAPSRTRTDALGRATARWRLGPTAGEQRLAAVVPAAPDNFLTFTATAIAADSEEAPAPATAPAAAPAPAPRAAPIESTVTVAPSRIALGGTHACFLSSGSSACRGANDRGQRGQAGGEFVALASGVSHVCALDRAGTASCWGANQGGQLGDESRSDRNAPVRVSTELRFSSLSAGAAFTCGLTAGGRAACWGQNLNGQLGDGSRDDRRVPQMVDGERSFRTLVAGWNHVCGVGSGGETFCWGLNGQGQIGDGTRLDRLVPTRIEGTFQDLVAGASHSCGLSEGRVLCWGGNGFGQLGDGTTTNRPAPRAIQIPGTVTHIAAGAVHTCALVSGGAAYCWGQNLYGQLGDGTTQNRSVPTRVEGTLGFSDIYAGGALTCAVALDGVQYCWGLNQNGQLGDGSRQNRSVPTRVGG